MKSIVYSGYRECARLYHIISFQGLHSFQQILGQQDHTQILSFLDGKVPDVFSHNGLTGVNFISDAIQTGSNVNCHEQIGIHHARRGSVFHAIGGRAPEQLGSVVISIGGKRGGPGVS